MSEKRKVRVLSDTFTHANVEYQQGDELEMEARYASAYTQTGHVAFVESKSDETTEPTTTATVDQAADSVSADAEKKRARKL